MASRFVSSICTGSDGSAAGDVARRFMMLRAFTAGAPSETCCAFGVNTPPPALASRVLNQTVTPSYWAPWISIRCGLPCLASASASLIISVQVLGGDFTRSERYHSSWVLLL